MRLSRFSDYALRACLYLSAHGDRLVPIAEIARSHDLSQSNLMKVVNLLVDGGVLSSTRGRHGGVTLAKAPQDIYLGDVVRLMEGNGRLVDCSECLLDRSCGLVKVLHQATEVFYAALNTYDLSSALTAHPRTLELLLAAAPSPAGAGMDSDPGDSGSAGDGSAGDGSDEGGRGAPVRAVLASVPVRVSSRPGWAKKWPNLASKIL
jgi:Rrf2 family nitric oxide-sensitive transcriptional repressor